MARPIAKTPIFEGKDAVAVLKEMKETSTKEDEEFSKEIRELFYSQDNIFFLNSMKKSF